MAWRKFVIFVLVIVLHGYPIRGQQGFPVSDLSAACPPQEIILPCRCATHGDEVQIWCSHSDLPRVMIGLKSVSKSVRRQMDELILENNNLPSLPGRVFSPLQVMRLMLRHNSLERLSNGWLMDLEESLVEIYIVEQNLRSIPFDSLSGLRKLEAATIQSENLKLIPDFSNLPKLRYINIQSSSLTELPPLAFQNIFHLETVKISESTKLNRLEAGLFSDLPRLVTVNLSNNGITWIHLRALTRLANLKMIDLSGNRITDAGMVGRSVKDLRNLEILKLNTNRISILGEGSFVDLPSLKELYLNENIITEIRQGAFHRTPNLKVVRLENNYLKRVHPESFLQASGSGVEILHLQENEIARVEELRSLLDALPTLRFLDLSHNKMEFIPYGALHGHGTLEQLYLDHNQIKKIDRDAFIAMPALRELRLKNNSLTDTMQTPFWNLPGLKGLDLSGNKFQTLEPDLLMGLPSLRRLDMSQNSIRMINPLTFTRTAMLETINMSKNYIESIYAPTFRSLDRLYEVDMSDNMLREFLPGLPRAVERVSVQNNKINVLPPIQSRDLALPNLRMLDISRNIIQRLPRSTFEDMPQLRTLNLAKNELLQIDDGSLAGLERLEVLNLQENRIQRMHEDGFSTLGNVNDLNLQGNRIDEISGRLFDNGSKLKRLDLSRNNIMHISPTSFRNTRSIQALDLSSNKIRSLPESLARLNDLREVDISFNQLSELSPEIINSWQKMEELRASSNKVAELRSGLVRDLPDLQYLDMSSNEIRMMEPGSFTNLPQIQEIVLADNQLQEIPDRVFDDLPNLQAVHLQQNYINNLAPETFFNTPSIVYLNLSSNHLQNLESAGLRSVRSLEVLDLSNNGIRRITQNPLRRLDWLVELNLDNNRICRVQGEPFSTMPRLRILTMRNNRMTSMPETTFRNLRTNIAVLDLDGNPLDCSCKMIWYRSWLQENEFTQQPGPRCGNGKMLRDIPMSRQECEIYERNNQLRLPLTNDHGDLFSRQIPEGNYCDSEPLEELQNNLPPSPEESEYFDQFVDYPNNDTKDEQPPPPASIPIEHNPNPNQGKAFNNSNTLLNLNNRPIHAPQNPFTIFGIPIPSFGQLWGQGRHANGRSSFGSRGRGRVQLYKNDDPELLKLLNKNEVRRDDLRQNGYIQNPDPLDNRPIFQTPFLEPQIQKGGFIPIVPGTQTGFQPLSNQTEIKVNETNQELDYPDRFEEVIPLVQTEKKTPPKIEQNNTPVSYEVLPEEPPTTESNLSTITQDFKTEEITQHPEIPEEKTQASTTIDSSKYEESELEIIDRLPEAETKPFEEFKELTTTTSTPKPKLEPTKSIWISETNPNELLSALVAPGAQQGIFRNPPNRGTITKVFTPSPPISSTSKPPFAEEFQRPTYESHTHHDNAVGSNDFIPATSVLDQFDSPKRNKDMDWYYKNYNNTEDKFVFRNLPKNNASFTKTNNNLIALASTGIFLLLRFSA